MTFYEFIYLALKPFEYPLYYQLHRITKKLVQPNYQLLDVGGRASPQTIGLNCDIYISDLPRTSALQKKLQLGIDYLLESIISKRRSNVRSVIYDDMERSKLDNDRFDLVMAVEVLEHVNHDTLFLSNIKDKLKEGGVFIMSTPNGEFVPNVFPDHVRHYRKVELEKLLESQFSSSEVFYSIIHAPFYNIACKLHANYEKKRILRVIFPGIFFLLSNIQLRMRNC